MTQAAERVEFRIDRLSEAGERILVPTPALSGAYGGGLIYDALGSYERVWQGAVAIGLVAGALQITAGRPGPRPSQPALLAATG